MKCIDGWTEDGKVETKLSQIIEPRLKSQGFLGGMCVYLIKYAKNIIYDHEIAFNGYHIIPVNFSHIPEYIPACTSPAFVSPLVCSCILQLLSLLSSLRRKCDLPLPNNRICIYLCGLTTLSS